MKTIRDKSNRGGGYWSYRDNRYVWIAGRWEVPPHTDAKWMAPRWEREASGYRYYEGYWE